MIILLINLKLNINSLISLQTVEQKPGVGVRMLSVTPTIFIPKLALLRLRSPDFSLIGSSAKWIENRFQKIK